MNTFIQYALLGLGASAGYVLLAQGLVVIHTASGVVNFAQGMMAMLGAFVFYELHQTNGWNFWPAAILSILFVAAIGVVVYQVIMRPLRNTSALSRVIATLGVLLLGEGIGLLIWGSLPRIGSPLLPSGGVDLGGGIFLGYNEIIMFGIAVTLTVVLWASYRYTRIGLAIRAAAETERGAATLGWSATGLGSLGWGIGGAVAALAGILISPLSGLQVDDMTLLVIPVLAAALAGGFVSFPLTLLGAVLIGLTQSLLANYAPNVAGLPSALPFGVIILFLVIRGKSLPVRGSLVPLRLPGLGTGQVNWVKLILVFGGFVALTSLVFPTSLIDAITISLCWGIVLLSVVVLMGFAGQVDLAPLAWGGIAALITSRLVNNLSFPFEIALLVGVCGAIPVGVLFGIPALRARGINLAIVTLGLGLMLHEMVFANTSIAGGSIGGQGTRVGAQTFFGINVGAFIHPQRYMVLVLIFFTLLALMVASLRRGRAGRRLLAVRANERAAAALGISVFSAKLYAFGVAAAIAAVGGTMLGFSYQFIDFYNTFSPIQSMLAATHAVIGGVGFVLGPLFGSTFATGGFGTWTTTQVFPNANPIWVSLVGGVTVLQVLLTAPDGLLPLNARAVNAIGRLMLRPFGRGRRPTPTPAPLPAVSHDMVTVKPATLAISDLTVRYGGVTAVTEVSLTVNPGEIVGVIGPNGAGKTSLIDAVTGFTTAEGAITLDGVQINGWPAYRIARAGVVRSFQSLELFESSTVRENIRVAADPRDARAYVTDLVRPGHDTLSALSVVAIRELGLEELLDRRADALSYGQRRLAAIARTIASGPSLLLLDEPASGLSETESMELVHIVRRLVDQWQLGVLVVEHDMQFVMGLCDRIVVLDFGRKIAEGTPAEIRANPAVITAYLGEPEPAGSLR